MDEKLKVKEFIKETHDSYTLKIALAKPLDFKPGQFVMAGLSLKDKEGKERVMSRAYSIASSPTVKDHIDLVIKEMPEGFISKEMGKLKAGDDFYVKGPFGHFTYEESMGKKLVLIGAGSGLAPLLSISDYIFDKKLDDAEILLIFSNKKPEDIICRKKIEAMTEQHSNFKHLFTVTRPQDTDWQGQTGHVDKEMLQKQVKDLTHSLYYLCGPPAFVKAVSDALQELGVPKEKIKEEKYD